MMSIQVDIRKEKHTLIKPSVLNHEVGCVCRRICIGLSTKKHLALTPCVAVDSSSKFPQEVCWKGRNQTKPSI